MILISRASQQYPPGERIFSTGDLPPELTLVKVSLSRENWPVGVRIISANIEVSLDSGQTWQPVGGAAADGGEFIRRNATIAPNSTFAVGIPDAGNPSRRILVSVSTTEALQTSISIEAL